LTIYQNALGFNHPDVARSLIQQARIILFSGNAASDTAITSLQTAIKILDETKGFPDWRADALSLLAQFQKKQGAQKIAISNLSEALRLAEHIRSRIGGGDESRANYFVRYADEFNRMVAWQVEANNNVEAIAYAERGRARVLLDQLVAGKIDLYSSIPVEIRTRLEKRETDAKAHIAEYQQRITLLRSRKDLAPEEINKQITELEGKLRTAYNDYEQVNEEIKNTSPLWNELITSGGKPVSIDTIQGQLVAQQSLMLIYQIGKEGSFLFVIPPARQKPEVLRLQITDQVASILGIQSGPLISTDLQKILTKYDTTKSTISLIQQLLDTRGVRPLQETRLRTIPQLHALWQVLVPTELWPRLVKCSEVILIPDGALNLLPFEALVVKEGKREQDTRYWLDEGPVIRYAPSATTLYNIEQAKRTAPSINKATVLSLSDPIYDPTEVVSILKNLLVAKPSESDSSKARSESILAELDKSYARDSYESIGGLLNRLPGTARETKALRNVFRGEIFELSQLNANEAKLRAGLSGKRYVHLATHGIINQQQNSFLAALALTPPLGETTNATDDGFLQLYEIFDLKIPDCELAVLSACQTNIGRNFEGEGVFALSRGFLAAGARRVVASQWSVDDVSTAELIGEFFRQVADTDKKGQPINYALALRGAKRKIRQQKQWAAPYFWAPFVLTGKK
jgi:CHAT domain-containing protein